MSMVICKLPNAGLGNQLFPLMHAQVFAELNHLPIIVVGYHRLKIGPYLRGEKSKRSYNRSFCFQKNLIREGLDRVRVMKWEKRCEVIREPEVRKMDEEQLKKKVFIFEKIAEYDDYFGRLKDYREQVKRILYSVLNLRIKNHLVQQELPVVGVHIRMGDFRTLLPGEEYRSGHVRTPQQFFVTTIKNIRKINGKSLPVTLFTDGYKEEVKEMLELENVKIAEKNPPVVDLLLLSKSKIILPTHGSTFSAWAGFLSDAPVVLPFPYQKPLREDQLYNKIYEGKFEEENQVLQTNIKRIDYIRIV